MAESERDVAGGEWRTLEQQWASNSSMTPGGEFGAERMCKILAGLEDKAGLRISDRRWRLFTVACLRRVSHIFQDSRTHLLVDAVEAIAEGLISQDDYIRLDNSVTNPPNPDAREAEEESPLHCAQMALACAFNGADYWEAYQGAGWALNGSEQPDAEEKVQVDLIRDIFGNPFRPITLSAAQRTPTVVSLARSAYDERHLPSGELDPQRLAVLADALEEARAPAELVEHLRSPRPHVRGCHALDLVLGLA